MKGFFRGRRLLAVLLALMMVFSLGDSLAARAGETDFRAEESAAEANSEQGEERAGEKQEQEQADAEDGAERENQESDDGERAQEPVLARQTIKAEAEELQVKISGNLPKDSALHIKKMDTGEVLELVSSAEEDADQVLFACEVEILDGDGNVFEPSEHGESVEVEISGLDVSALKELKEDETVDSRIRFYHVTGEGEERTAEQIGTADKAGLGEDSVTFTADTFSGVAGVSFRSREEKNDAVNNADDISERAYPGYGGAWCTNQELDSNVRLSTRIAGAETRAGAKAEAFTKSEYEKDGNTYVYWQTRYLTGNDRQTTERGNNGTKKGVEVDYIRYYYSAWQYSSDEGDNWENLDFRNGQLVFYYFQKTELTEYAQINVSDWWHSINECTTDHSRAVYVRIIDEDTKRTIDTTGTLYYHHDHSGVGGIYIEENEDSQYEIVGADVQGTKRYNGDEIEWNEKRPTQKYLVTVQSDVDITEPIAIDWGDGDHQIINLYVRENATLSVKKELKQSWDYKQEFDVQVTLTPENGKTLKDSYKYVITKRGQSSESGELPAVELADGTYQLRFTLKAGEKIELKGVESGTKYKVEEVGDTSGYTVSYKGEEGTTKKGRNHNATITNTKKKVDKPGSLTIKKTFKGLNGSTEGTEVTSAQRRTLLNNFKIQVTGGEDEVYTVTPYTATAAGSASPDGMIGGEDDSYTFIWKLETLTQGGYTVTESGYELGETGYIQIDATMQKDDEAAGPVQEITVQANGETTLAYTNTYNVQPKTASVKKKWKDTKEAEKSVLVALYESVKGKGEEEISKDSEGKIRYAVLSESRSWQTSWEDLPPVDENGAEITYIAREMELSEEGTDGAVMIDREYYTSTENGGTYLGSYTVSYINKEEGQTDYTGITNTFVKRSALTVSKRVEGKYADKTKEFEIKVTLKDKDGKPIQGTFDSGEDEVVFDEKGEAVLRLSDGESVELKELPSYVSYTVEEAADSAQGYDVSYESGKDGEEPATLEKNAAGSLLGESGSVTVVNKENAVVDTGISDMAAGKAALAVAAVVLFAVLLLFGKRMRYTGRGSRRR